jgi:hypothetical protein
VIIPVVASSDAVVEDTEIMIDGNVKSRTCHG